MGHRNTKPPKPLPNALPGAVYPQFVARGTKRWGPYWYRMFREGGRLHKTYVRPEDLAATVRACLNYRALKVARRSDRWADCLHAGRDLARDAVSRGVVRG